MAIAIGNATDLGNVSAASLTASHTSNGDILFVGVVQAQTSNKMSGVTYAGQAMTEVANSPVQAPGDRYMNLFYLLSPASGANNVVITLTGSDFIQGFALSYSGANAGIDLTGNTTGSSISSLAKSLVTTVDKDWTIAIFAANSGTASGGAGTTLRKAAGGIPQFAMFDSNGAITPAGSTTLTVNITGTPNGGMIMAAFKPGADTSGAFLAFM